jgi:hypothetical protein
MSQKKSKKIKIISTTDEDYTAGTFFSALTDDIRIYNRTVSP